MSMENAKKLLEELKNHPETEELLKECGSKTVQEYAEAVLSAAKRLGIETTVDAAGLAGYLESMEASRKTATDQMTEDMVMLDDDDLDYVAGGAKCGRQH